MHAMKHMCCSFSLYFFGLFSPHFYSLNFRLLSLSLSLAFLVLIICYCNVFFAIVQVFRCVSVYNIVIVASNSCCCSEASI